MLGSSGVFGGRGDGDEGEESAVDEEVVGDDAPADDDVAEDLASLKSGSGGEEDLSP